MDNKINDAIKLAIEAHENKKRKAEDVPYLIHPIEVGIILAKNNQDDDVIAAGIIHDAVEEEYIKLDEVEHKFGHKVKRIVEKVYYADKHGEGENYRKRKLFTIDYLREQASPGFKFVSCADKLSNVRIMLKRKGEIGDKVWENYEQSYEDIAWYHQNLVVSLNTLYRYDLYKEYVEIVESLFGEIPAVRFINRNLRTIDEILDVDVAENTSWLAETMISFLGKVISNFKIYEDIKIFTDVKEAMGNILKYYNNILNDEEIEISDEEWLDTIRVFYILRYFLKYHDDWIKENVGIDYLAWFKLYDDQFKQRII